MSQTGPVLARRTLWRALGWLLVGTVVVLSLAPLALPQTRFGALDKVEHALAYLALTWWFMVLARPGHLWRIAGAMLLLGALVEIAQHLSGWRRGEWLDLGADALGIALGWVLARVTGVAPLAHLERALGWTRAS